MFSRRFSFFSLRSWWSRSLLATVLVVGALTAYSAAKHTPSLAESPIGEAKFADIVQTVQAAGVLQPRIKVDVGAQVSGQIKRIHVELGQQVQRGDLLVSLDPEVARSEVVQAEAAVAQQGALIEVRQADLQLAHAEASRQRRLLKGQATAPIDAERAEVELLKIEADLRGQIATLKRLEADLNSRRLRLGYTAIAAPIDGMVVNLPVQEGQTVIAAQITPVMVTLAKMEEITVRARVPESDIAQVQVGQAARFVTLSGNANRYEGKVRVIQPVPERTGNAVFYNVLFEVSNRDSKLLSDMTVQVSIDTGAVKQALTVPLVALGQFSGDGSYEVQLIGEDGRASARRVRTGLQDGTKVQVTEGLQAGDKVLLAPPEAPASNASLAARGS